MSTSPRITLLVVVDAEKPADLLRDTLAGLRLLNAEALDRTKIVLLIQRPQAQDVVQAIRDSGLQVDITLQPSLAPLVGDYPAWNLLEDLRASRHCFEGEYLLYVHPEFLLAPGSLGAAMRLLDCWKPDIAPANLRRLSMARYDPERKREMAPRSEEIRVRSELIRTLLHNGQAEQLRHVLAVMPTCRWAVWKNEATTTWQEDACFIRLEWLSRSGLLAEGASDGMMFGDFFMFLERAVSLLADRKLFPRIRRLPVEDCRLLHLWHEPAGYGYFTESMRRWFFDRPDCWQGTPYLDPETWSVIAEANADGRRAMARKLWTRPGGLLDRWTRWYGTYLDEGGARMLSDHYAAEVVA